MTSPRRSPARVLLALVAAALLVLVACSSEDGADDGLTTDLDGATTTAADASGSEPELVPQDDATDPSDPSDTTDPTDDTGGPGDEADDAPDDGDDTATDGDLEAWLLEVGDLPDGYVDQTEGTEGLGENADICSDVGEATLPEVGDNAARAFTDDAEGFVVSVAARFDGGPEGALEGFRDQVAACDGGDEGSFSLEEQPDLGDEAIRILVGDPQSPGELWIARVDDVVLGVSFGTSAAVDPPDGAALLATMIGRG